MVASLAAVRERLRHVIRHDGTLTTIDGIITETPDVLAATDSIGGRTLLHDVCWHMHAEHHASPAVVQLLVERYPQALREVDNYGCIPIQFICRQRDVPIGLIQQMLEKYPESLSVARSSINGWTLLHRACFFSASLEMIRFFNDQCPIACLYVDNHTDKRSPYDLSVQGLRENVVIEYILEATREAACALVEIALTSKCIVPLSAIDHIEDAIPELRDTNSEISASTLVQSILMNFEQEQLRALRTAKQ
jgi:hypothetical protein